MVFDGRRYNDGASKRPRVFANNIKVLYLSQKNLKYTSLCIFNHLESRPRQSKNRFINPKLFISSNIGATYNPF